MSLCDKNVINKYKRSTLKVDLKYAWALLRTVCMYRGKPLIPAPCLIGRVCGEDNTVHNDGFVAQRGKGVNNPAKKN